MQHLNGKGETPLDRCDGSEVEDLILQVATGNRLGFLNCNCGLEKRRAKKLINNMTSVISIMFEWNKLAGLGYTLLA